MTGEERTSLGGPGTSGKGDASSRGGEGLPAGDKVKVWSRAAESDVGSGDGVGGGGGGSSKEELEEEEGRLEGERVEAAARRTALWAVARGHRKKLPDGVRVREGSVAGVVVVVVVVAVVV